MPIRFCVKKSARQSCKQNIFAALNPRLTSYWPVGQISCALTPEYDMGITGAMKVAHLAEALGIDCEIHAPGPAHRACMSAMRNTNYYEVALVGPDCPNSIPPVYACGYTDQLDCVDDKGCVPVPDGPGLGVRYDWEFIEKNTSSVQVFT